MDTFLFPIMWVIGWIMYGVHWLLTTLGLPSGPGPTWVLSIVGMTIVIRALIIPLYNRQIRATRAAQELNPEIQKIQKKYKGRKDPISQQRQQEELMALYKDRGTSPFSSCMPALIQMPIFFSLFRLLYAVLPLSNGTYQRSSIGPIDQQVATDISQSTLFGAPLTSSIAKAADFVQPMNVRVVAIILILLLMVTLFFQQKMMMTWNMSEAAQDPDNPAMKMQKYMLYGMPLIYVFTGFTFQVGVLVYWVTGNLWMIAQQTWMIWNNPTPGSKADKARKERIRKKRIAKGLPPEEPKPEAEVERGQREQPIGKERAKKLNLQEEPEVEEFDDGTEVRGKDGLTDAERAQKRYERRRAERERSKQKRAARAKKQKQNRKKRNF